MLHLDTNRETNPFDLKINSNTYQVKPRLPFKYFNQLES